MNALLDCIGEDLILGLIESGYSQTEVCAEIGATQVQLSRWFREDSERASRVRMARTNSAEAWMDRGLSALIMWIPKPAAPQMIYP